MVDEGQGVATEGGAGVRGAVVVSGQRLWIWGLHRPQTPAGREHRPPTGRVGNTPTHGGRHTRSAVVSHLAARSAENPSADEDRPLAILALWW